MAEDLKIDSAARHVLDVIKNRRSIRFYKSDHVPEKAIKEIIEAARWAPSAHNFQPTEFVVIRDNDTRKFFSEIAIGAAKSLYGDLTVKQVRAAVEQALSRLRQGETHLAVHPHCGTNLATTGFLAGLSAFVVLLPRTRRRLDQLPFAILAATLAVVAAQPLGLILQAQVTTSPDVRNLIVKRVTCRQQSPVAVHYVETAAY